MAKKSGKPVFFEASFYPVPNTLYEHARLCLSAGAPVVIAMQGGLKPGKVLVRWSGLTVIARILRVATIDDVLACRRAVGNLRTDPPNGPCYVVEALD